MNYKFTLVLFIMLFLLAVFGGPAHSRNDYLNEYNSRCGDFETRIEVEDRETDYIYGTSDSEQNNYRLNFTYRKYLGVDCKTVKDNLNLKQQLELMKMCGRVNNNPSLALNSNFALLVGKCRGVSPTKVDNRPEDSKSYWDDLKDEYKLENPGTKLMGDKFIKKKSLKMPPKDFILPEPKPEMNE